MKDCLICSTEFAPKNSRSKYCSKQCSDKAKRDKYRATDKWKATLKTYHDAKYSDPERYAEQLQANRDYQKSKKGRAVMATLTAKYRATKKQLTPSLSSIEEMMIQNYYEDAARLTEETGIPHHVDHIIPIARLGWHHPFNLRVITAHENQSKGARI